MTKRKRHDMHRLLAAALIALGLPTAAHAAPPEETIPAPPVCIPSCVTLSGSAEATRPAVRIGVVEWPDQYDDLYVAPGLHGLPFAPAELEGCDKLRFYRVQWNMPPLFDRLGWRESNCRNESEVRTWCCFGAWQLYFDIHTRDHRMIPVYDFCEVDHPNDYNDDEPLDWQKQACVAAGLYRVDRGAWSVG